jgi:hypothetical protein
MRGGNKMRELEVKQVLTDKYIVFDDFTDYMEFMTENVFNNKFRKIEWYPSQSDFKEVEIKNIKYYYYSHYKKYLLTKKCYIELLKFAKRNYYIEDYNHNLQTRGFESNELCINNAKEIINEVKIPEINAKKDVLKSEYLKKVNELNQQIENLKNLKLSKLVKIKLQIEYKPKIVEEIENINQIISNEYKEEK